MNEIPPNLLPRYLADPLALDAEVRAALRVPEDRYYTVSVWPVAGQLRVDWDRHRVVRSVKISKSPAPA